MLLQIGMPIGPRAKLLAEISKLTAAAADAQSAKSTETAPLSQPRQSERRQITIMFCDLVGSTTLAEQLDPEDFSSVMEQPEGMRRYHQAIRWARLSVSR